MRLESSLVKAIRVRTPGGPEALSYEEVPIPSPRVGEALVKLDAIGVNFIDTYIRSGAYPRPLPLIMGQEGAGVVEAVGSDVTELRLGDRVAFAGETSAYAEYAVVNADRLVPVPDSVSSENAAAAMLQGITAHYLSHSTYPIAAGDTVLVHAAAGGVGLLLTQMAKMRGAHVVGTVSTEEKAKLAVEAGVDDVIFYTRQDFGEEVGRFTSGRGVQAVYDSVGKTTFEKSLRCLAHRGFMVLFGQSSGPVPTVEMNTLRDGALFLTRPSIGFYTATREELLARAGDVFRWIHDGSLRLHIDHVFPLREVAEAHRRLESRKSSGKLLLVP